MPRTPPLIREASRRRVDGEAHRAPIRAGDDHVFAGLGKAGLDQFIVVAQVEREQTAAADVHEPLELGLLHVALPGAEDDVVVLEGLDRDDRGDLLIKLFRSTTLRTGRPRHSRERASTSWAWSP